MGRGDWGNDAIFTQEDRDEILAVSNEFSHPTYKMIVAAFMIEYEYDETTVRSKMREFVSCIEGAQASDYTDSLHRVESGTLSPTGYILENGDGSCARDIDGCPICVCTGMFACKSGDAKRQMNYLVKRLGDFVDGDDLPRVTYVFDLKLRDMAHDTLPGMDFAMHCLKFPQTFRFIVCGASSNWRGLWRTGTAVLPTWMTAKFLVCEDYLVLDEYITKENQLRQWGGSFDFSFDEYLQRMKGMTLNTGA